MYKHILIPTDGSEVAEKAIAQGIEFAREAKARVTLFTAVPEYEPPSEAQVFARRVVSIAEHARECEQTAKQILERPAQLARAAGLQFDTDYEQSNQPWQAIVDAAKRHGCDAIFMASHGRKGLSRLVHGSQTVDVLTHSDIPTLVVR
ncbi:MAG TPA: universal stress protein [Burkholderiales bacterium]|jgi:nucleotide-binding universal stress UspA family protein|nr:universal stress protein [Burkholderiales bacterium]